MKNVKGNGYIFWKKKGKDINDYPDEIAFNKIKEILQSKN